MANIFSFLKIAWWLSIALFIPIALPVGGAQTKLGEFSERSSCPFHLTAGFACEFKSIPFNHSKVLRKVALGTPMQVLNVWESPEGVSWFHVQITSLTLFEVNKKAQRGWIHI